MRATPDSISYSTAPKLNTSERASSGFPCACSGDMYAAVPITVPSTVCVSSASAVAVSFANPKSSSLMVPFLCDQNVAGFQIAMQNASPVRFFERGRDLKRQPARPLPRAAARSRAPLNIFHH